MQNHIHAAVQANTRAHTHARTSTHKHAHTPDTHSHARTTHARTFLVIANVTPLKSSVVLQSHVAPTERTFESPSRNERFTLRVGRGGGGRSLPLLCSGVCLCATTNNAGGAGRRKTRTRSSAPTRTRTHTPKQRRSKKEQGKHSHATEVAVPPPKPSGALPLGRNEGGAKEVCYWAQELQGLLE